MSKIIEEAQKTTRECEEQLEKIDNVQSQMEAKKRQAENRLTELRDQIANVLVSQALGEVTTVEVSDLRRQRVMFQQFLEDVEPISEQFEVRKAPLRSRMHEAERTLNQFERYQTFKRHIKEGHGTYATQNDLRDYAKALGLEADCEAFLCDY